MGFFQRQRAVVIGAGVGGLAAAAALGEYFGRVEIMERDDLPDCVGSRPGTPQDRHPHGMLAGGLQAPQARGERPQESRQFEAALFRAAVVDPVVHRAAMVVVQLLAPDSILQEPKIQRRVRAASSRSAA
jgi:glycine/D-amino acid oxidase-like deaminating enzyme